MIENDDRLENCPQFENPSYQLTNAVYVMLISIMLILIRFY
jgi:hypothetical protein